jgi:hypothetical protein
LKTLRTGGGPEGAAHEGTRAHIQMPAKGAGASALQWLHTRACREKGMEYLLYSRCTTSHATRQIKLGYPSCRCRWPLATPMLHSLSPVTEPFVLGARSTIEYSTRVVPPGFVCQIQLSYPLVVGTYTVGRSRGHGPGIKFSKRRRKGAGDGANLCPHCGHTPYFRL